MFDSSRREVMRIGCWGPKRDDRDPCFTYMAKVLSRQPGNVRYMGRALTLSAYLILELLGLEYVHGLGAILHC